MSCLRGKHYIHSNANFKKARFEEKKLVFPYFPRIDISLLLSFRPLDIAIVCESALSQNLLSHADEIKQLTPTNGVSTSVASPHTRANQHE